MKPADYRIEIDGLRAVAVLAVLAFHADLPGFDGGFVGVDVFFVISGFLITRMVVTELEQANFSLVRFYARRVRRLGPALMVTVAATLAAGLLLASPTQLLRVAHSALHALASTANLHFWTAAGYFDAEADFKPLLHMWSLSVEEQFYLFWPLLLLGAKRWAGQRGLWSLVALTGAGSLGACVHWLAQDEAAAFFLAPLRAFELAIGALTFLLEPHSPRRGWLRELLTTVGLGAIALAVFTYTRYSSFPGFLALLPCFGTAMVIFGGSSTKAASGLRVPLVRHLGLISYSLYLVHWPLLSYYRSLNSRELNVGEGLLLSAASIALAELLHRYIEQPFRKPAARVRAPWLSFPVGITASICLIGAVAVGVLAGDGWSWRFPVSLRVALDPKVETAGRAWTWQNSRNLDRGFRDNGLVKVLVIGDSQGADFANMAVGSGAASRVDLATFPTSLHCQVMLAMRTFEGPFKSRRDCAAAAQRLMADRRVAQADVVLLAFGWFPESLPYIEAHVARLKRLGARRIAVLGRKDQGHDSATTLAHVRAFAGADLVSAAHRSVEAWSVNERMADLPSSSFRYLDLMSSICFDPHRCHVVDEEQRPIFFDRRHFTSHGAAFIGRDFFARPEWRATIAP